MNVGSWIEDHPKLAKINTKQKLPFILKQKPLEVSDNSHFLCTVKVVSREQSTKTRELQPVENSSAGHLWR